MSRGMNLVSNNRAINRLYTQCEGARRTTSFSTQATVDIDSLFHGIDSLARGPVTP